MISEDSSAKTSESDPIWIPTKEPGLYRHRDSKRFYSRITVNGKRPYVSLKTKTWSKALAIHKRRGADAAEANLRGDPRATDQDLQTLGDCVRKLLTQLELTDQSTRTKCGYRQQIQILMREWPAGSFDRFDPADVTFEILLQLRKRLLTAKWEAPAGFKGIGGKRTGCGYSNRYVNQVLARFQSVMALARFSGLCDHDPFESGVGIHGSIWLPLPKRSKDLPTLGQMKEVFRIMAGVPKTEGACSNEPNYLKWRLDRALDAAEHAEFLAYSGCRLEEANSVRFEDILPPDQDGMKWIRIHGTKTESSDRTIPVFEDLARLIERIRDRRQSNNLTLSGLLLNVRSSRNALATACKRVGVTKLGHHSLRHYFATLALSRGVPVQIVADWMGHKDKGITLLKTYAHVIREQSAAYSKRISYAPQHIAQ